MDNYKIPKGQFIAVDSYTAHRDEEVWNTGREPGTHSLDTFWADRFIIDAENKLDGPLRQSAVNTTATNRDTNISPRYSMDGLSGSWLPFGGGKHQCPRRYFARHEMMICIAVLCSEYDVEFLDKKNDVQVDYSFFGIGTMPSKGDVPVRVTRRQTGI